MGETREAAAVRDVAVVGVGQMGRGIARNLDRAGRLAAAWDCNPEALQRAGLSPAVALAAPGTLAGLKAVVFVVPSSGEIRSVLGDGGLLRASHQGQVLIDLTTSHPAATRALAAEARATGRSYLDCGMTGGAKAADGGTLTLMVGGDSAVVDACRPLLGHIAGKIFHVGEGGAGHAMKLVHNMICHTVFLATSEGCRLAERLGIPLETAIAVVNAGNARSYVSEQRFPNHVIPRTFDGRSRTANLAKDLEMAADLARTAGEPGAYSALAARLLAEAMRQGLGEEDFTRLYEHLPQLVSAPPGLAP
jgi:3-hydroxyisobutyrate dehydrogenase